MNKLANVRWSDRMPPLSFRPQQAMAAPMPPPGTMNSMPNMGHVPMHPSPMQNATAGTHQMPLAITPRNPEFVQYSFNIPFTFDLAGPNTEDILHATQDAVMRWTHPAEAPDNVSVAELPVHVEHLRNLDQLCLDLSQSPLPVKAVVETTRVNVNNKPSRTVTVLLSGPPELVQKSRETIMNGTPIAMTCSTVDVDGKLVCDLKAGVLKQEVMEMLDSISHFTGVDIFLLGPKLSLLNLQSTEGRVDKRWRIAIYGDVGSVDHAKVHVLLRIDQMLGRALGSLKLEPIYHQPICGRHRKTIKLLESATGTSIYFPPHLLQLNRFYVSSAHRRDPSDIFITGETEDGINRAKAKLQELASLTRIDPKEVEIDCDKMDNILLSRLDKVRKIGDTYGTHIALPGLGTRRNRMTVRGADQAQCERTIREILDLTEFVSGKKNGKLNKIIHMVQKIGLIHILFEGYNEYNFNIEVISQNYKALEAGISYVEQEMPASISFHVPDQYHKKIIGIGGHHIQSIMRKHSVFVKFSNALDRGGAGREEDDLQVGNVVCRTPARNAQNLEAVKSEILEMVDEADSEYTSQIVSVDRLFQRRLLARLRDLDKMEKKYNCKILFPSTEQASDEVTVIGPQWNVPRCADELLGMVPDFHEMVLEKNESLSEFLDSAQFSQTLVTQLDNQEVSIEVRPCEEKTEDNGETVSLLLSFTRNNAAGLGEVIEQMLASMTSAGVDVKIHSGSLPRPKSDSFEDSLPFFNSKLLQNAPVPAPKESPVESLFVEEVTRGRNTLFDRLRKPGGISIASFLDRRKNSSHAVNPATLFTGSTNVSMTSLISIESTRSFHADRNPWNDSGVNLDDDNSSIMSVNATNNNGNNLVPPGSSSNNSAANPWALQPQLNPADAKLLPTISHPGDTTPRHLPRASGDSGRPSTSHSINSSGSGYPGPANGPTVRFP
ncbi:hypothetical protein CFIMG_002103RA [Ceratocystis fimbriata CBS 114723]|uniref:K Homology domain-containing protein n=1 Tax=Ceratocystis fimbriata CBS 114723 TaxID=1035309 RepID=A0A2C5XA09_9PEZI|nr:hypothetical protein CFIMG_002103RA [Ceratocystis fimbriata CBS 114723]